MLSDHGKRELKKSILRKFRSDYDGIAANANACTQEKRTFNFLSVGDVISLTNFIQDFNISEQSPLFLNNFFYNYRTGQVCLLSSLLSAARAQPRGLQYNSLNIFDFKPLNSKDINIMQVCYEIILHNEALLAELQLSPCDTEIVNLQDMLIKASGYIKEYDQNTNLARSVYVKYMNHIEEVWLNTLNNAIYAKFHYQGGLPRTLQVYRARVKELYDEGVKTLYYSYKNGNNHNDGNPSNSAMLKEMHAVMENLLQQPWYNPNNKTTKQLKAFSDFTGSLANKLAARKTDITPYLSEVPLKSKLYWYGSQLSYYYLFYYFPATILYVMFSSGDIFHELQKSYLLVTIIQSMHLLLNQSRRTELEKTLLTAVAVLSIAIHISIFLTPDAGYSAMKMAIYIAEQILLWAIASNLMKQIPSAREIYQKIISSVYSQNENQAEAAELGMLHLRNNESAPSCWKRASDTATNLASSVASFFRVAPVAEDEQVRDARQDFGLYNV